MQTGEKYRIIYTASALRDLADILRYISVDLGNPVGAKRLVDNILIKTRRLEIFPEAVPVRLTLRGHDLRFLKVKRYIVIYYLDGKECAVVVHRILYTRRDIDGILM